MNTTENNKLIAEFMGYKKVNEGLTGYETPYSVAPILPSGMLFNSSWDWLMPVAIKIRELLWTGEVLAKYFIDKNHIVSTAGNILIDLDKDGVYEEVVAFIKWYNNRKDIEDNMAHDFDRESDM